MANMEQHEILYAVSFLKMAIKVAGMPKKWIAKNSKFSTLLKDADGKFLNDSNGKILIAG